MAASVGYSPLQNEEEEGIQSHPDAEICPPTISAPSADMSGNSAAHTDLPSQSSNDSNHVAAIPDESPPPYVPTADVELKAEDYAQDRPPMYSEVVKLPSYHESENLSELTDDESEDSQRVRSLLNWGLLTNRESTELTEEVVGSDLGFVFCFMLAFVFNWLGFLFAYCATTSLACNYGAFAGLGLSLIKWTFIIKHAECCKDYFSSSPYLVWCFLALGIVIFVRGIYMYGQAKRALHVRRSGARRRFFSWSDDDL